MPMFAHGGCETITSELRIHYGGNEDSEGAALSVCPARAICVYSFPWDPSSTGQKMASRYFVDLRVPGPLK